MKHKQINIISCLEEISSTGLDNENKTARPYKCETPIYLGIDSFAKIDPYYKNFCVDEKSNNSQLCTYGNNLVFVNQKPQECNSDIFWTMLINFINNNNNNTRQNFFFISHHNRLKKTIFKTILNKDKEKKRHFANCSCTKIYYENDK